MPKDTPLHKAAYKGVEEDIIELLDSGIDVNVAGAGNRTPIHRAVGAANIECVELLIERGADVSRKDGSGRSPMHWAAVSGSLEVFILFALRLTVVFSVQSYWWGKVASSRR